MVGSRDIRKQSGRLVFAILLVVGACGGGGNIGGGGAGGGQKPEGDKPPDAKSPVFETSWLGNLSKTYDGELSQCTEATRAALRNLDLEVTKDEPGMFEKTLEAESKDGTSLVVTLKEVTKDTTRISIKVGYLLGDKDAARRIHSEIEDQVSSRRAEADERKRRWRSGALPPPGGPPPPAQGGH